MRPLLAVVAGGLLGSAARLGVDLLLPHGGPGFPWGTLLVNVTGSFLLGLLVARLWPVIPDWLRAGLGPGLLGSFTTFSALAVSIVELTAVGVAGLAVLYLVVSLAGGLAAALLGLRLGTRRVPPVGVDE